MSSPTPVRREIREAVSGLFESLESRRLLAANPVKVLAPTPRIDQMPEAIADRIDAHLWAAVQTHARGGALPANTDTRVRFDAENAVQVYIRVDGKADDAANRLRDAGVNVEASNNDMGVVQGWVPSDALDRVASLEGVNRLEVPDYAVANVTSAGDAVLNADKVRSKFALNGIDGTGIKIGVISDGVNHKANVAAELPTVTVNPSIPGNGDEGTAMLEIVHDLARGAQLYFSGPQTSVQMVNSINYFMTQGCTVIVDDLGFLAEGYFTDTAVAQAAQNAVANGVVYVTAAGNFGTASHYQGNYTQGLSAFDGGVLHRFGAAGQDVNELNIPANTTFRAFLEWSDGWGASSNNYDLFLYNGDTFTLLDSSKTVQNGNDNPYEFVTYTNNTNATIHAQIWINRKTGAAARELELFTIGNSTLQFSTQGDAIFGHAAIPEVMSVAAASAASPSSVESFSSRGGSTIYSNFTTQTKSTRQSLDGTAIDGVQTAVGAANLWPHNPFYGTSAAAPHAAAIAALVRQAKPSLTPAQVLQAMASTAVDLGAAGYDTSSGAGRYDALGAVYSVFTPGAPDLTANSDSGISSADNITNDATPTFLGSAPQGSAVQLLIDGVASTTITLAANTGLYNITVPSNLSNGLHTATIRVAAPGGLGTAGQSLISSALSFVVDTVAPTVTVPLAFNYDTPVQNLTMTFSEDLASSFDSSTLVLSGSAVGNVPAANKVVSFVGNKLTMTFGSYPFGALPDGDYTATFAAGSPTDAAGNAAIGTAPYGFFALAGDASRNHQVGFEDLLTLAQNYGSSGKTFTQGNFDYDPAGKVDFNDLLMLAQRYGNSSLAAVQALMPSTAGGVTPTPKKKHEPLLAIV